MGWRARRDTTVLLPEWIPAPGDAFIPDGDGWKPEFTVRLHKNLADRLVCHCGRLPVGGQAFEHVGEPGFGIVAVAFGAFDHGVDDGGILPGN